MLEIHNASGRGKLIIMGNSVETLRIELVSDGQSRTLSGLTKTRIEKMRNRAGNAGAAFPRDMPDATLLYRKGSATVTLSVAPVEFGDDGLYTETRDGQPVLELAERTTGSLKRPVSLDFADGDDALSLEADCTLLKHLADALLSF